MKDTITVFLTPTDADNFKLFNEHYDLFQQLKANKVFEIGFGKCTLNFAFGQLQNIVREEVVYKRPS